MLQLKILSKWAARTYVVAALGSLAQLLYWASMLFGGRRVIYSKNLKFTY